mgnify:CR=1 FL=1
MIEMIADGLYSDFVLPRRYSSYYIAKYKIQEMEVNVVNAILGENEDEVLKRLYQSARRLGENSHYEVDLKLAVLKSMERNRHMGMDIRGHGFAAICSFGSVINTNPPFSQILSRPKIQLKVTLVSETTILDRRRRLAVFMDRPLG